VAFAYVPTPGRAWACAASGSCHTCDAAHAPRLPPALPFPHQLHALNIPAARNRRMVPHIATVPLPALVRGTGRLTMDIWNRLNADSRELYAAWYKLGGRTPSPAATPHSLPLRTHHTFTPVLGGGGRHLNTPYASDHHYGLAALPCCLCLPSALHSGCSDLPSRAIHTHYLYTHTPPPAPHPAHFPLPTQNHSTLPALCDCLPSFIHTVGPFAAPHVLQDTSLHSFVAALYMHATHHTAPLHISPATFTPHLPLLPLSATRHSSTCLLPHLPPPACLHTPAHLPAPPLHHLTYFYLHTYTTSFSLGILHSGGTSVRGQ